MTGDIVDNSTYGNDIAPDWDDSDLNDVISFHTDIRTATTWTEEGNSYWPGRFDYTIASDIGATVNKTFTICTHEMPADRLNQYGLNADDTDVASDHLPKITDFIIEDVPGNITEINNSAFRIYPNPAVGKEFFISSLNQENIQKITISNITGKVILLKKTNTNKQKINLSSYPSGIYFIKIKTKSSDKTLKLISK